MTDISKNAELQQSCITAVMCRTCSTCGHQDGDRCMLSGFYCETERRYPDKCGIDFKGWIPKPIPLPKIGLKQRLLSFWYGT